MPSGLLFPADEKSPVKHVLVHSVDDIQALVGGYFMRIPFGNLDDKLTVYMLEDASVNFDYNPRITRMCAAAYGVTLDMIQKLAGPALILGPVNDNGDETDMDTEKLLELFITSGQVEYYPAR